MNGTQIIFTVFDKKLGAYANPFVAVNKAVVIREFSNNFKQGGDSPYFTNPEDFAVYAIGTFDSELGSVSNVLDSGLAAELVLELYKYRDWETT